MKNKLFATVALLAAAASANADGIMAQRLIVSVPFEFHVYSTQMPAGKYDVTQIAASVVRLRGGESSRAAIVNSGGVAKRSEALKVSFRVYGDKAAIAKICGSEGTMCRTFMPTKLEKEWMASAPMTLATIPAEVRTAAD